MDEKQLARRRRILAKIQEFTLMDDDFMTVFFNDDIPRTEFVLRIIMENPALSVKSVKTQYNVKSLEGRSVRLDVRATDSSGKVYDIEIQRADKGAGARRARYNSALMDADETVPNMDTESLPETCVIFITENDVLKKGLAAYHISRRIEETGEPFGDGTQIIYVNGSYRGDDPLGSLMHDFSCRNAGDMKSSVLAEKARLLKEHDKGVAQMCRIMEDFAREEREEAREERNLEFAEKLLRQNKMSAEEIAEMTDLPIENVRRLAEKLLAVQV